MNYWKEMRNKSVDRKTALIKIISMRRDIQDVEYGLVELQEMYKELGITFTEKGNDMLKTAMNYLVSAEDILIQTDGG